MKHTRYIATTIALSCVLGTGGAWADGASTSGNSAAGDRGISRQIATQLLQDTAVGPNGIRVKARNGFIRLSGSVGTVRDWKRAQQDARDAPGVEDVQNDLSVLIR